MVAPRTADGGERAAAIPAAGEAARGLGTSWRLDLARDDGHLSLLRRAGPATSVRRRCPRECDATHSQVRHGDVNGRVPHRPRWVSRSAPVRRYATSRGAALVGGRSPGRPPVSTTVRGERSTARSAELAKPPPAAEISWSRPCRSWSLYTRCTRARARREISGSPGASVLAPTARPSGRRGAERGARSRLAVEPGRMRALPESRRSQRSWLQRPLPSPTSRA